ncbi:DBH-like monooxygenase protein 1 [Panulirus ornatus]|uniref:DBH-like monooxygenase protein 1 n=1 Tax=Panulirus ornatus TaxID=150431 RepID=UPI003A8BEDB9
MAGWVLSALLTVAATVAGGSVGVDAVPAAPLPPMDFQHRALLDQEGTYFMLWTPREKDIIFEVQVATQGYVGLGFSPNGGMKGADIIIGWVDDAGQPHLQDRHGEGNWLPSLDDSQDVVVHGGMQNDTHTVLRFSRLWNTCDEPHDFELSSDTIRVIWAYGYEDPEDAQTITIHSRRGTKSLYLLEPRFSLPEFTDDVTTWEIYSPNVSVPADLSTLYWCKLFKVPPLRRKTHVIGYQPVIEERNLAHVHHMLLYECHLDDAHRHYEKWLGIRGTQCYSANMPVSWLSCTTPIVSWAVGSEGEVFPEHVGFPIGADHGGANYFMLEIHYDNPSYKKGIVDGSGLRIFHTEKLRQYDAATLALGHSVSPTHIIPPAQRWKTIAHCSSECTQQGLPEGGVKAFQALLHAHVLGTDITLRHIRRGRELPVMFKDLNYDFNYQQVRVLSEEATILPGDAFITECGYDSRSKTKPVFGGFSTDEEMCLVFVMYYPRVDISLCTSASPLSTLISAFGLTSTDSEPSGILDNLEVDEAQETERARKMKEAGYDQKLKTLYLHQKFHGVNVKSNDSALNTSLYDVLHDEAFWKDDEMLKRLQETVLYSPHTGNCRTHGRKELKATGKRTYAYPDFLAIKGADQRCEHEAYQGGNEVDLEAYLVGNSLAESSMSSSQSVTSGNDGALTSEMKGVDPLGAGALQAGLCSLLLLSSLLVSTLHLPHL